MSIEDRKRWDGKHLRASALTPRASVAGFPRATNAHALALDVACGQGRHSFALARAGYRVVAMDASREALRRVTEAAAFRDGRVHALQADADAWPFADDAFDAIVQVDFLDRALFPALRASLRRGGLLLIDTFLDQGRPNAEGPSRPDFVLSPGELGTAFADLQVLSLEETRGDTARGRLLARKP